MFTETRKRARAFVRTKLGEGLQAGSTTAGVTGRIWSEVIGRIDRKLHTDMRRHTKPNQPAIGPQIPGQDVPRITYDDVLEHNARRNLILGIRVDNVIGVTHNRGWARRRRGEMGKGGPATDAETWGCWYCKLAKDQTRREEDQNRPVPKSKESMRQEWQQEATLQLETKATLKHILCGECQGLPKKPESDLRWQERCIEKTIAKCSNHTSRDDGINGGRVTTVLKSALQAVKNERSHTQVSQQQWTNRWAMLAGVLPEWAENGDEDRRGPVEECVAVLDKTVDIATDTLNKWHNGAKTGDTFMQHRQRRRGLLQLVVRAWREQTEYNMPALQHDPTRWVVRQTASARVGTNTSTRTLLGPILSSNEKQLAETKCEDWQDVNVLHRLWSPWLAHKEGKPKPKPTTQVGPRVAPTPPTRPTEIQLRWQLRDKCLRVATYYRVMKLRLRAEKRDRLCNIRRTFRKWAPTAVQEMRDTTRRNTHQDAVSHQRESRAGHASASTRMNLARPNLYNEVRRYHKRQHPANGPATRRVRLATQVDTQIGLKLHANMRSIARQSVLMRNGNANGDG